MKYHNTLKYKKNAYARIVHKISKEIASTNVLNTSYEVMFDSLMIRNLIKSERRNILVVYTIFR